ncbi:MAG: hypothetical protein Q6358_08720 [Candidatus Brocadiales bacterium]|uniref:hypothetical protein n=1 Tax=Candidatus Wunengus sp. YC60 TaxID=3367697 RepID=UPI0027122F1D|nr:hypothetical protein [Candidatus Brocadiales bacterium]
MEGNNGKTTGFINNLIDTFGKVVAWGVMLVIVISIVTAIAIGMMRTGVKYAIDFTLASAAHYAKTAFLDNPTFTSKVRENVKEAVEYSFKKVKRELLQDEALNKKIRENTKEAIEYALQKVKNEALNDVELNQKIKTNTKEAIEHLFDKVKQEAITDGKFIEKVKTNVKEGIEFTVHQAAEHK